MAYSPSPQPGAHGLNGTFSNIHRHSISPPLPQIVSKRDKRRNALSDRLNDISANFAQNRDNHYRSQVQGLHLAINFISNADPYQNRPLDDNPIAIYDELSAALADNAQRVAQAGARSAVTEVPAGTEKGAASYVKEINDEMEIRDASLTAVANRYNYAIDAMARDAAYRVEVAYREHEQLVSMMRDRVYQSIQKRRLKLIAERDSLDGGDTTTSLFHQNQFGITNPDSPGGLHSNRKTRHLRHRLELEEVGIGESNKRKRKAPPDTENGSPSRAVDSDTTFPWKEANAKLEAHNYTPAVALDQLFTEKEVLLNLQRASRFAVHNMSMRYRDSSHKTQKDDRPAKGKRRAYTNGNASSLPQSSSSSDSEGPTPPRPTILLPIDLPPSTEDALLLLEAPLMDRTANSSYHATRSTAVVPAASNYDADILEPGEVIGRRAAIALMGLERIQRKREDDYQRAPLLTETERDHDRAAIAMTMEQLRKGGAGKTAKKTRETLINNAARERLDHIAAAEALTQESSLRETLNTSS